jgi:hypothetical protein
MSDEAEKDRHAAPQAAAGDEVAPEPAAAQRAPRDGRVAPTESLNRRLLRLELEGQLADDRRPARHLESADLLPAPATRWSPVKAIAIGFALSLAVGLAVVGWINRDALITAWRDSPRSTLDLYPPRLPEQPTRMAVTVADPPAPDSHLEAPRAALATRPEVVVLADSGQPCSASLAEVQAGILQIQLHDRTRAGHSIAIRVDEFDYRASFAGDGELVMFAPRLFQVASVRWQGTNGTPCSTSAAPADHEPQLRVGLVWEGDTRLALHILEPKGFVGAPAGHISADRPNLSSGHGAGQLHAFGQPSGPTRLQVYLVDLARLGHAGVLTAMVTLEPAAALEVCAGRGQRHEVRYQIYTLRTGKSGDGRPEIRSLAFELPDCAKGKSDPPVERIAIRF